MDYISLYSFNLNLRLLCSGSPYIMARVETDEDYLMKYLNLCMILAGWFGWTRN